MEPTRDLNLARRREELAQLHEALYPRIVRYIGVRIGDFNEAEDLASEVFLRALKAIGTYHERGIPIEAWVFRIAHNILVDHLKARSRRPETVPVESEDLPLSPSADSEEGIYREEQLGPLQRAMSKLTDAQRQVLALRFSDADMTSEQIAQVLGKKPTAVREMQSAAIRKLRAILGTGSRTD